MKRGNGGEIDKGGLTRRIKMNQYINFIQNAMNYASLNKNVISDNIANYNTPNYKSKSLEGRPVFELNLGNEQKSNKLKITHPRHISSNEGFSSPETVTKMGTKERFDGNSVDMNIEMMDLMKNNSLFKYSVEAINKEMMLHKIALGSNN